MAERSELAIGDMTSQPVIPGGVQLIQAGNEKRNVMRAVVAASGFRVSEL